MPLYQITDKAGPYVAGRVNEGAGTTIFLTEREAAHDLRVGSIVPAPEPQAKKGKG